MSLFFGQGPSGVQGSGQRLQQAQMFQHRPAPAAGNLAGPPQQGRAGHPQASPQAQAVHMALAGGQHPVPPAAAQGVGHMAQFLHPQMPPQILQMLQQRFGGGMPFRSLFGY